MSNAPRYICPVCRKRVAVHVPRGGDASAEFFKRHRGKDGFTCKGWGMEAKPEHRAGETK